MKENFLYIERAKKALEAAKILRKSGLLDDAFSRGYYAILHLGYALLLEVGESPPKTHAGLVAKLFGALGRLRLSKSDLSKISRFQALRESGDYAALSAVTALDLSDIIDFAEKLLSIVEGGRK